MSRYIDADKIEYTARYVGMDEFAGWQTIAFKSDIDKIPTADVVEVRHGRWVGMDGDKCSECGHLLSDIMDADSYYAIGFDIREIVACPFCGAKMDGERSEGE